MSPGRAESAGPITGPAALVGCRRWAGCTCKFYLQIFTLSIINSEILKPTPSTLRLNPYLYFEPSRLDYTFIVHKNCEVESRI